MFIRSTVSLQEEIGYHSRYNATYLPAGVWYVKIKFVTLTTILLSGSPVGWKQRLIIQINKENLHLQHSSAFSI